MKAVRIHEHGDESVLRYEDAPDPAFGADEVLVRVRAASINRGDLGRRSFGFMIASLPAIIGWDIAGDVVEVGANVRGLKPGQRVVAMVNGGGYAELAPAPAALTVPIPDGVSYEEAASLPIAWLTAWISLLETAGLKAGETALVQACSSGVGMAGVQIAKHVAGASLVFTTAGTDAKCARGLELGADHAVNYTTGDFVQAIMDKTGGRGVDVALDMVGGDVFRRSQAALAEGGRLVSVGRSSGQAPEPDALLAESKRQEITTNWLVFVIKPPAELAADLAKILDLVAAGELRAVIDRVFPLAEAAAAHRYLGGRNQFGKVILKP